MGVSKVKLQPMPKVGVDHFVYALLTADEAASADEPAKLEYSTPVRIPGLTKIGFNSNASSSPYYADNGSYAIAAQNGDLVLTVDMADVPPEVRAEWFGQDHENGLIEEGQISPAYIAVGYRVKKAKQVGDAGESYRYFWFYKCIAMPPSEAADTQNGSINFQGDSITINCAQTVAYNKFRRVLDDNDPTLPDGVTPELIANKWFTDPLWAPEAEV